MESSTAERFSAVTHAEHADTCGDGLELTPLISISLSWAAVGPHLTRAVSCAFCTGMRVKRAAPLILHSMGASNYWTRGQFVIADTLSSRASSARRLGTQR